jgi:hypothetical protein
MKKFHNPLLHLQLGACKIAPHLEDNGGSFQQLPGSAPALALATSLRCGDRI